MAQAVVWVCEGGHTLYAHPAEKVSRNCTFCDRPRRALSEKELESWGKTEGYQVVPQTDKGKGGPR